MSIVRNWLENLRWIDTVEEEANAKELTDGGFG